jgi:hypothetical protein
MTGMLIELDLLLRENVCENPNLITSLFDMIKVHEGVCGVCI